MSRLPLVSTMLTPVERARVDAAGMGLYEPLHRDSLDDLMRDVRERNVSAVIVSVTQYIRYGTSQLGSVVRDFPRVTTMALLSDTDVVGSQAALDLGQIGVRTLIDGRHPSGWSKLREVLSSEQVSGIYKTALVLIRADLGTVSPDCWYFFQLVFTPEIQLQGVRAIARHLRVLPSTLLSRFFRAALPAPKRYLAYARLIRVAGLFEDQGRTVANVSDSLHYSSPQSFGRHMQRIMGISPLVFRRKFTEASMLERFRQELVLPHVETLRTFEPGLPSPSWTRNASPLYPDQRMSGDSTIC